ncbi:MAG TPA: hypothetical protein VJ715_07060, partial [Pyrinomonadaceae bacterium]|nr:hypothetical protein [Pyrinomonadaceae bacterium]
RSSDLGGSIIGAHYYLALRELLESRSDSEITQEDYLRLVKNIEEKFVEGVQQNIRTRALAELLTNLQRVLFSGYSRTRRVGELYEREIFSRIGKDEKERKRRKRQKLWMSELRIHPMNEEGQQAADFDWRYNNWLRRNKVPALVINAATLNTGHSWHFTPFEMGEPPPMWESNIETNYYLPVIKYEDAPERFPRVRLGHAVAASSCVPGLFEPLVLDNLYEGKSVLLVDGGVCDNQGIQGLLQNNCDVILVSDGSGQTGALDVPGSGVVGVLGRSAGISQARVREAQYYDLKARKRSSILREFLFLHLKEGLIAAEVNVVGWPQRSRDEDERRTGYGVARDVQELLAGVRTDLDSFCDAEAYALMASAYRMTERALSDSEFFRGRAGTEKRVQWKFLDIEDNMRVGGKKKEKLKVLLKASASRTLRFWKMTKPTKYAGILMAFALLAGAVVASRYLPWRSVFPAWSGSRLNTRELVWAVAILLGLILLRFIIGELYQPAQIWFKRQRQSILYRLIGVILLCGGFLIARLHLWTFDKLFLALGRLKRFKS